jgi:hypothetical protein
MLHFRIFITIVSVPKTNFSFANCQARGVQDRHHRRRVRALAKTNLLLADISFTTGLLPISAF